MNIHYFFWSPNRGASKQIVKLQTKKSGLIFFLKSEPLGLFSFLTARGTRFFPYYSLRSSLFSVLASLVASLPPPSLLPPSLPHLPTCVGFPPASPLRPPPAYLHRSWTTLCILASVMDDFVHSCIGFGRLCAFLHRLWTTWGILASVLDDFMHSCIGFK